MVNTVKFSQFVTATPSDSTVKYVGTGSGTNIISQVPFQWTTAERPASPYNGLVGYNLSLFEFEFWNSLSASWEPIGGGGAGTVDFVGTGTGLTGGPITSSGTISFAPITANSLWANNTSSTAVPVVIPLSTFLLSANNLSDLTNPATARTNLGLAIGTNVEAWSPVLDELAGGTYAGSTSITTLGTITTGVWNGSVISVPFGGTGNTSFTANCVICAGTTGVNAFQNVSSVGSAGQVLTSNGIGNLPTWQSTTGGSVSPGLINEIAYYAASGSTISGFATGNNGVLITSGSGVPSISSTLPNLVQTNITQLGTITTGVWNGTLIPLAFGGTNANLTASNGGVFYSTATAGAILLGTATANQILLSGASSAPSWSTATYPSSTSINQILYSSSANIISGITAVANGLLVTNGTGVPSISTSLPATVQASITQLGTITTGVWNGTPITVPFGGTGNTTFTPYSVITAGTTATGSFQNVVGVGTTGQVLTSNGAAALPTWQTVSGSGTVNPATANDLAYYSSSGSVISGLASANGGVLVTSNTGVPSLLAGSGSTGTVLQATSGGTPAWSTATYPASTTVNQILYSSAANVVSGITTLANGVLIANGSGVPTFANTLSSLVQGNITTVGTIGTGIWNGTTIAVANGGTGNTTFTAYSVICAGTTATGAFQNVSGLGSSGQVLVSNGAGALPSWQNVSGTGTVNSGTSNDLAYYATSTNAVSPLASANGGVLVTSNTGVPSILAGSGTTGTILQATGSGTPAWSTTSYPAINAINTLLYASSANVMSALPTVTTAVLTTSSGVPTWANQLSLALGGTNAALTASNGGIFYSTASAGAILSGTATAGLTLLSGASGAPTWSTLPPITKVVQQIFTAGGTYTPTSGMKYCLVQEVGGGGGSGGAVSTTAQSSASGGGQSGGYNQTIFTAATVGSSQTITIGAAGTAGASNSAGGNGGQTSFGLLLTANGGNGSTNSTSSTIGVSPGGSGGGATSTGAGIFAIAGQVGGGGFNIVTTSSFYTPGKGGSNPLGFSGQSNAGGGNVPVVGVSGTGYGSGAAGAGVGGTSGVAAGAAGTAGIVIITEYCSI